jgi:hypothetical protein
MESRHDPVEVKAYLLGELSPDRATSLEQRYFLDRAFFLEVVQQEERLIHDYLSGRLTAEDRRKFESRYLQNPSLAAKVSQARERMTPTPRPPLSRSWRMWAAVAAAGVLAIAVSTLRAPREHTSQVKPPVTAALPVRLLLTPGVAKGPGESRDLQLPLPDGAELVLDIPGAVAATTFDVTLFRIAADGRRETVWQQRTTQLTLRPPVSVLTPGDYLISAESPDSTETFLFRVLPPK